MSRWVSVLAEGKKRLAAAGVDEADTDARLLLEYAAGISRSRYLLLMSQEMDAALEEKYLTLIGERCTRKPLQYITGIQEFMGLPFLVNRHVLIPRQDTEVLAETACKQIRGTGTRVLDLCTGSGCIGLSIAKRTGAMVTCADISGEALATAKRNADALGLEANFAEGDLFEALTGQKFDLIVSNPPYIPAGEIGTLMPEVREFEPKLALDGAEDGLFFYRRIAKEAPDHLEPSGSLLLEIGCGQAEEVTGLLKEHDFQDIRIIKDLAGLDRVVCARLSRRK